MRMARIRPKWPRCAKRRFHRQRGESSRVYLRRDQRGRQGTPMKLALRHARSTRIASSSASASSSPRAPSTSTISCACRRRLEGSDDLGLLRVRRPAYEKRGIYYYNGSKLDSQAVIAARLAGVPRAGARPSPASRPADGNNPNLSPFRSAPAVNAFNEGWAEYAATLTGEMGLYDDPYDRYGRLSHGCFLTSRLVVDTGMNALGWSLERAAAVPARRTTLCAEARSDSTRCAISCGIRRKRWPTSSATRKCCGLRQGGAWIISRRTSVLHFHSTILEGGALPFPIPRVASGRPYWTRHDCAVRSS